MIEILELQHQGNLLKNCGKIKDLHYMSLSNPFKILMCLYKMLMFFCAEYLSKEELKHVWIRDLILLTRLAINGYMLVLFKTFDHSKEHGTFLLNCT